MPPRRTRPVADPVTIVVDGERVVADAGEPLAMALVAAGRLVLGRSVKYHRPRGPACFAARCDGCLMRVDGLPNVMTCRAVAREGRILETQNVVGTAEVDLLAATDWFFPAGMDHHHMFTQFGPVNRVMQGVARRIAGIGQLPSRLVAPVPPRELACEVLVVGAGPAGLAAAAEIARAGRDVAVVDEERDAGGQLAYVPGGAGTARALCADARAAGARVLLAHGAAAIYEDCVLVHSSEGVAVARPARIVVAAGTHEGAVAVEGNDLPGVIGARATARLLARGILPGERVVLAGGGSLAAPLVETLHAAGAEVDGPHDLAAVRRVRGGPSVRAVDLASGPRARVQKRACDAVVLGAVPSAAYELAAQAGARVVFATDRFVVEAGATDGRTASERVRAVGSCTGLDDHDAIVAQARAAGRAVAGELAR